MAFQFDRIPKHPDRRDLDLADVARLHEHGRLARGTDSARRPHYYLPTVHWDVFH
jgi:hypothetical protein